MTSYDFSSTSAASQPRLDRRRRGLVMLLTALLALTLLIGLLAIGGYFYLRNNRSVQWTWQDPLTAVDAARVRADLAVIALLEQPGGSLVQQAVQASEPDTAYAILVHNARSSDAERSGSAQLVGRAFEQIPAQDLAALSYQQMLDVAALSPIMADPMRAQVSLDAARGLVRAGLPDAARPALQQAEVLARYSPLMAPVQRQDVARQLQVIYRDLDQAQQAAALDQLVREPRGTPTSKFVRGPFLPQFASALVTPDDLQRAIDERKRQVFEFLQAWDSGDAAQIEAGRSRLAGALLAEDRLRRELLPARDRTALELSEKTAVALDHAQWLALKYMVGSGALGFAIVPEWGQALGQIATDLRAAYDQVFSLYRDQAAALANVDDARAARVEILRQQNLLGRLGLYPGYDEAALGRALEQAQRDANDILPLLVRMESWGGGQVFRIVETFD
ncbi:MAG: hypothetical protein WA040_16355 [Anaerolineae bacterium]